jgi:MFS family permease
VRDTAAPHPNKKIRPGCDAGPECRTLHVGTRWERTRAGAASECNVSPDLETDGGVPAHTGCWLMARSCATISQASALLISPVMGKMSDAVGRKTPMVLLQLGLWAPWIALLLWSKLDEFSLWVYFILAKASPCVNLYFVVGGKAASGHCACQARPAPVVTLPEHPVCPARRAPGGTGAYISDVLPPAWLPLGFGMQIGCYGLAQCIGPSIAAHFGVSGQENAIYLVNIFGGLAFLWTCMLPESLPVINRRRFDISDVNPLRQLAILGRSRTYARVAMCGVICVLCVHCPLRACQHTCVHKRGSPHTPAPAAHSSIPLPASRILVPCASSETESSC